MPLVVSDTSPIRALVHLQLMDLLHALFDEVLIPPAVASELTKPPEGLPFIDVAELSHVEVRAPQDTSVVQTFLQSLDPGESEAIALALEVQAAAVLIDEAAGRMIAKNVGLQPIGVLGILVRAKQRGLVDHVRPLMDQLVDELGFFLSDDIRAEILRQAAE